MGFIWYLCLCFYPLIVLNMPVYHFTVAGVPLAVRIPQFEKPLCKYRKMKLQRFGSWNLFLSIGKEEGQKPLSVGPLVELISNLDSKNINMPSVTPASDCRRRSLALGILISSLSTFQISSRSMQPMEDVGLKTLSYLLPPNVVVERLTFLLCIR
jgi:hypothetical protein